MIKVWFLILEPVSSWDRIVRAQRSVTYVLFVFLIPLLGWGALAEGSGLVFWGKPQGRLGQLKKFPVAEAVVYEAAQVLLFVAIVFISAWIIKQFGETFQGRRAFTQTFTTVAYGLSPLFALRVLDVFPAVNPWIGWGIGILLSLAVLYQGVPRVMLPDPPQAFGLYVISCIFLVFITGLARLVTAWYLEGRFKPLEWL